MMLFHLLLHQPSPPVSPTPAPSRRYPLCERKPPSEFWKVNPKPQQQYQEPIPLISSDSDDDLEASGVIHLDYLSLIDGFETITRLLHGIMHQNTERGTRWSRWSPLVRCIL